MYFKRTAFTLLEILLVIVIISMLIYISYPVGSKIFDKFQYFIEKAEKKNMQKKRKFEKFMNDEDE